MHKKLVLIAVVVLFVAASAHAQTTVRCESTDGRYRECSIDGIGRVMLTRQLSDTNCVEGKSWGYRDGTVWVNSGCRGEFALTERGFQARNGGKLVVCESIDGRTNHCAADTSAGVQLVRQMSDSSCGFGTGWGYDANGVWVANGCRAEFAVRGPMQARATIVTTTPVPVAAVPVAAEIPLITCQSTNNGREHCRTDTRFGVTLHRQISDNPCVRDRTWGVDRDGVWVTNGCRGEFTLGHSAPVVTMISSAPSVPTLVCESIDGRRNRCAVDTTLGVRLLRQLSDSDCLLNRTWGVDADGVWVSGGCRAEFAIGEGGVILPRDVPQAARVMCESKDGMRTVCPADTRLGVAVVRQVSDSPCILNSTWGYNSDGIWVTAGCRAEFVLRR
jgi:hypothetical protein